MLILIAALAANSAFEPVQIKNETLSEIVTCFEKRAQPWINGSFKLTLYDANGSYQLTGPKPSSSQSSGISITFREGQRWVLLMFELKTGVLDLGGSTDPKHREYQPNPKFAREKEWYGKEATRITNAVAAICRT